MYLSDCIVSEQNIGPVILVALTAHHIPTLMTCTHISCINLECSDNHYLLF